jgi:hypothetical protein
MADYRDLAIALGGGYGQDTGGITPDTLATLRNGKTASASDLLGMLKAIGSGSLSNLESLVRGGVAQIPGAGGDLEGLARMGINKAFGAGGVNVSPTSVLPTTTDILGMMPRKTAVRPESEGMEELGGYMSPATAKLAGKAIKATEGLPVGMGIKDVGKNIFEDATKYHQKVPEIKSINVNKLKRMNAGEVADVSDEVAAKMDFSKPIQVSVFSDGELRIVDGHHRVAAAKKLGIQSLPVELQAINAKGATLNKLAQEATYPQQAALDLAQQRAALPVEQGGLGLPVGNTSDMRAAAMGFDVNNPLYHATDVDFASIRPSLQGKLGAGVYVSPSSQYAEKYTSLNAAGNARVLPLVARGKLANDDVAMNIAESIRQEMAAQNPNFSVSEWKKRTTQALADAGYDGRNMSGFESVITNPSNVRSRFAAFDPFRKDVATATAMGVALPDLLAAEKEDKQKKLSKALTK